MVLLRKCALQLGPAARGLRETGRRFSSSLPSSTHSVEDEVDTRENETVAPDFTNRNPRNLEQMVVARKERGWKTTWPKREYWHRLRLERTQRHVEAYVEHSSGCVVVSASTREWAIKKHLRNTAGVAACENVGRVLAQRCLEGGINFVDFRTVIPWEKHCDSIQKFQNAMTEGGVVLKELRRIYE
ncbi:39S ribosomal protein L18, mitochondrial isoform X2 [Hemicordylus capensis]|uniref:39S ribosomal protein L18, mitochondrial isoform X2 n=1 Tax=Hemicordylus capensis TaxID=884348 RepID=UPI002303FE0F|nr:39S ribosomal protein L18, mitochondrial isoform X2 [Hemicordylus capensis]